MSDTPVQQEERTRTTNEVPRSMPVATDELIAFCPKCKTMETLWFSGNTLVQTRKFSQDGPHVYHDCGSDEPCRLLIRFQKPM